MTKREMNKRLFDRCCQDALLRVILVVLWGTMAYLVILPFIVLGGL